MAVRTGPLTREQYESWKAPADALAMLPTSWSDATKKSWIECRLRDGVISAASCKSRTKGSSAARSEIAEIVTGLWSYAAVGTDDRFWSTGDVEFARAGVTGYGDQEFLARHYNVRFDPYEFERFIVNGTPESDPPHTASTVAPEMYQTMVFAHEAHAKLAIHFNDTERARTALIRRLSSAVLLSAAQLAITRFDGEVTQRTRYSMIPPSYWDRMATGPESDLWVSSELDVDLRVPGRFREFDDDHTVTYLGVRFIRNELNQIASIFSMDEGLESELEPEPCESAQAALSTVNKVPFRQTPQRMGNSL